MDINYQCRLPGWSSRRRIPFEIPNAFVAKSRLSFTLHYEFVHRRHPKTLFPITFQLRLPFNIDFAMFKSSAKDDKKREEQKAVPELVEAFDPAFCRTKRDLLGSATADLPLFFPAIVMSYSSFRLHEARIMV